MLPVFPLQKPLSGMLCQGVGFYRIAYAAGWDLGNIVVEGLMAFPPTRLCDVHTLVPDKIFCWSRHKVNQRLALARRPSVFARRHQGQQT